MVDLTKEIASVAVCAYPNEPITTILEFSHDNNLKGYFKSSSQEALDIDI